MLLFLIFVPVPLAQCLPQQKHQTHLWIVCPPYTLWTHLHILWPKKMAQKTQVDEMSGCNCVSSPPTPAMLIGATRPSKQLCIHSSPWPCSQTLPCLEPLVLLDANLSSSTLPRPTFLILPAQGTTFCLLFPSKRHQDIPKLRATYCMCPFPLSAFSLLSA